MKQLFTLICLFYTSFFYSQVVYTNIDPDIALYSSTNDVYMLDFNNDLTSELLIYENSQDTSISGIPVTFTGSALTTLLSTQIVGTIVTLGNEDLLKLDTIPSGQVIDSALAYINTSTPSVFPGASINVLVSGILGTTIGDFQANQSGYIGVKFDISGSTHYGWIRVMPSLDGTYCTILDYAYESTPNTGIIAGDFGSGFIGMNELFNNISLSQNNRAFNFVNNDRTLNATIYDSMGKKIKSISVINQEEFYLNNLTSGIYFISTLIQNNVKTFKIYIK